MKGAVTGIFFGFLIFFISCNDGATVKEIASKTTHIELEQLDSSGRVTSIQHVGDKTSIKSLFASIKSSSAPAYKCGYDIRMKCTLTDSNVVVMDVNTDPNCRIAAFLYKDELHFHYLSKKGVKKFDEIFATN